MDTLKRKVYANPPSTNDEGQSSKSSWKDVKVTEYFVKTCLGQVASCARVGTCFTKKGWLGHHQVVYYLMGIWVTMIMTLAWMLKKTQMMVKMQTSEQ